MSSEAAPEAPTAVLSKTRLARRAQVLESAGPLFLRDGYNATTMEGVANAAEISKATLYKYFPDKDELLLALVRERYVAPDPRLLSELHGMLYETLAELRRRGGREDVKQSILQLLRTSSRRRDDAFYRILIEIAFAQPALLRRVRAELARGRPEGFLNWTARATEDLPPEIDGRALLHLLFVVITGYTVIEDAVFGQERIDAERLADTFATLICAAIK